MPFLCKNFTPSVVDTTKESGSQDPVLRITAHQPRVKAEEQSYNLVVAQQQEQDSVSIQNQVNSHADVSVDIQSGLLRLLVAPLPQ